LSDYIAFSFNPRIVGILFRTIAIALSVSAIAGGIGLALAIMFEYSNLPHRKIFNFLLFIPFLMPTYIFTFSWMGFLGKRGTFTGLVFPNIPLDVYNPLAVVAFLSLSFFPIATFIISLGLKNIDSNLINSARFSNRKKVVRKILLPLIRPHLLIACFFVFVLAVSEYTVPAFLRVNVYSSEIFAQLAAFFDLRRAIVLSLPLIALALLLCGVIQFYFRNKSFTTISSFSRKKETFIFLSRRQKILAHSFVLLLLLFSLLIPVGIMLIESETGFFGAVASSEVQIFNSISTSLVGAFVATFLGFLTFYFLRKSKSLISLISFPLAISSPVIGISLINFYNSLPVPIYGTVWMVILSYLVKFLPFSILIFSSFFPQISPSIEESARLAKSSLSKRIYKIILPLTKGGFVSSFAIVFILCIGEVGVAQMVVPPGFQTISMRIETLMHYANYSYVASLSLFLLLVIFFVYLLYSWTYRKSE
jgi:iron(III) transport system permease protein